MNKRKIVMMALSVMMVAILAMGGTLAYLYDTDSAANVFTTGNVTIDLIENFGDNDPATPEKLLPATGSAQDDTLKNGITKEVSVKNTGSEKAYVRVHIAIPQLLDDGADTFDASANLLHFNYDEDSVGAGKWDWSKTTGAAYTGDWNYYEEEITVDGKKIMYNVYVVTYEKALESQEVTAQKAMSQVYLDKDITNDDIAELIDALGQNWQILVVAEGAQEAGFANAYDALNASFGVPGTYAVDWAGALANKQ